jgi:hypothetical protein
MLQLQGLIAYRLIQTLSVGYAFQTLQWPCQFNVPINVQMGKTI